MDNEVLPVFYVIPLMIIIWFGVTLILRKWAGMEKELPFNPGELIRISKWGSATVNGVNANGCVKINEYKEGLVLEMMGIFGGGKLWIPTSEAEFIQQPKKGILSIDRTIVRWNKNTIHLLGSLSKFVSSQQKLIKDN